MHGAEKWCCVVKTWLSCCILDELPRLDGTCRKPSQERVAIVSEHRPKPVEIDDFSQFFWSTGRWNTREKEQYAIVQKAVKDKHIPIPRPSGTNALSRPLTSHPDRPQNSRGNLIYVLWHMIGVSCQVSLNRVRCEQNQLVIREFCMWKKCVKIMWSVFRVVAKMWFRTSLPLKTGIGLSLAVWGLFFDILALCF